MGSSWLEASDAFYRWFHMYCHICHNKVTRYSMIIDNFACTDTTCNCSSVSLCRECNTVIQFCRNHGITIPCINSMFTRRQTMYGHKFYLMYHRARYSRVMTQLTCMPPNGIEFLAAKKHYESIRSKWVYA